MYSYLRERLKHAVRFRHKRGYGVHSPFVFSLIMNVIRDKTKCNDYPDEKILGVKLKHRERKLYRLLFRLGAHLGVKKVGCLGIRSDIVGQYLSALDMDIVIYHDATGNMPDVDLIYIGRDSRLSLQDEKDMLNDKVCVVITDIYKTNAPLWRRLKAQSTVTLDMMWYGILFFDKKFQRGHYNMIL